MSKIEIKTRTDLYAKLAAPFPDEAYGADTTRGDKVLTSLKAYYVVERLNQVFGLGNWVLTGDWKELDDGILFVGTLTAGFMEDGKEVIITTGPVAGFGGEDHSSSGDAYKSARTDSLSKAASLFGIGAEMYKGKIEPRLTDEQKRKLDVDDGDDEGEEEKEERSAKPARQSRTRLSRKEETEETEDSEESSEEEVEAKPKSKLRPARDFKRFSRFKSKNREEMNGSSSESTDSAS